KRLGKHPLSNMPGEFLLSALTRDDIGDTIANWLRSAEKLPDSLDIERIKGLVFDAEKRQVAFNLLGNSELVSPRALGLGGLLALARRADPALSEWAHRYLLQHMRPEHFAEDGEDAARGAERLFELALGAKEPEPVRLFAQTYLRCHHPKLGRTQ